MQFINNYIFSLWSVLHLINIQSEGQLSLNHYYFLQNELSRLVNFEREEGWNDMGYKCNINGFIRFQVPNNENGEFFCNDTQRELVNGVNNLYLSILETFH